MLDGYWGIAAPLIARQFGGEVEKFIGDGIMAVFNSQGDQPDHAQRAAQAALALQRRVARMAERHPDWPRMRIGVNSGGVVVRELGGDGHVAYPSMGDTVNTGARLERLAPVGGVLIGPETYVRLPAGAVVEEWAGLRMKGKDARRRCLRPARIARLAGDQCLFERRTERRECGAHLCFVDLVGECRIDPLQRSPAAPPLAVAPR